MSSSSRQQIIYGILGVPFKDLEYLTKFAAIRSNGSATAQEASDANQYVFVPAIRRFNWIMTDILQQ